MSIHHVKDKNGEIIPDCWLISWYPPGQPRQRRRFYGTRSEAEAWHVAVRRHGRGVSIKVNPRLVELADEWLEHYANDHSATTLRDVKNSLVALLPFFGNLTVPQLAPRLIEEYKSRRTKTEKLPRNADPEKLDTDRQRHYIKPRTVNKELSYLSSLCTWAADNDHAPALQFRIKKFPAKLTTPPAARIPLPEEMQTLIESIEDKYRPILLLYYDAGCRREEALHVRKEDVRLNQRVIHVIGKGNKERMIDIPTDRLYAALVDACAAVKSGYLFINPKTKKPWYSIRKAIIRAAKIAEIDGRIYAHLLRHTHCTHALLAGMDLRAVQGQAGHSTSVVTERYTHLIPELRARQTSKFNDFIKGNEKN